MTSNASIIITYDMHLITQDGRNGGIYEYMMSAMHGIPTYA
jgi:predicted nucleic acid-binding protein